MKLTDTAVRTAKPKRAAYKMADGHGLYIQIEPRGTKLWRFAYRFEGKQKRLALGVYPVVTLAAAREKHMDARRALDCGIDPAARRKAEKYGANGDSFQQIAALWYDHWKPHKSERYVATMDTRLKGDILPALGSHSISKIEAPEIVAMVKSIEARGAHELARRALEITSQIFRYAIANGLAQRNPAADVRPTDVLKPVKKVNRARVDAKELPALLAAIRSYRGEQTSLAMLNKRTKYVFPGNGKGHMSSGTILLALDRMGYRGKMTGHGFRGVASTLLHEQGWPHDHIELQLAHAQENGTSAAYNHALYIPQRREMMQAWADYLDEQLAKAAHIPVIAR